MQGHLGDWADSNSDVLSESTSSTNAEGQEDIKFRFRIKSASGLPQSLAHFVFCQYSFNEDYPTVVPSLPQSKRHEEFEFNWQSEEHEVACDALSLFVNAMKDKNISEDVLMEVLFVITFTYHLHFTDRSSLRRLVDEGMLAVADPDSTMEERICH